MVCSLWRIVFNISRHTICKSRCLESRFKSFRTNTGIKRRTSGGQRNHDGNILTKLLLLLCLYVCSYSCQNVLVVSFFFCTNIDGVEYGWLVFKRLMCTFEGPNGTKWDIFSKIFIVFFLKICLLSMFFFSNKWWLFFLFVCFGLNIYIPDGFCTAAVNVL